MSLGTVVSNQLDLETTIQKLGQELWQQIQGEVPGIFNRSYWQGRIMNWAMKDASFKVDLFRFVDVLPTLKNSSQIANHVRQYLLKEDRQLSAIMNVALKASTNRLTAGLVTHHIKRNVKGMAQRFIVGESVNKILKPLEKLHKKGLAFSVDLLGEATVSNREADVYQSRYIELIETVSRAVKNWPESPVIDHNHLGPIPRANISLKISAMDPHIDPLDRSASVARLKKRILPVLLKAKAHNTFVHFDLEQWSIHHITYDLFEELIHEHGLQTYPHLGIVVQAYLHSARVDIDRILNLARHYHRPITVRLVKGAYWDYEWVQAQQNGWSCPVFTTKAETDANYESLSQHLLKQHEYLLPAFASHNLRSIVHAFSVAEMLGVPNNAYEFQMIYGMAEPERRVLSSRGHRLRLYAPIGDLLSGIAYLVRRLLENTSNSGFLQLSHHKGEDMQHLLLKPKPQQIENKEEKSMIPGNIDTPFENASLSDFNDEEMRQDFADAVQRIRGSFPITVPVMINGKRYVRDKQLHRESPNQIDRLIAKVSLSAGIDVDQAVSSANQAWPEWRDQSLRERAQLVENLADRLHKNRYQLAALQCYEVAKPWREADVDVAEAIDFCRYYARQAMIELVPKQQGMMPGEDNQLIYQGRGTVAVIAPWNFPLAILCGMSTAALVAGNTVVMKPAEQSSAVAYELYEHMIACGFPQDVINFLPGIGEEVGDALVTHSDIAMIAFTGSKAVGLSIIEKAAKTSANQFQLKRVVCEMGGKNAIIVDDDADLDEAVLGIIHSAFGYAGQKCSACSRVLVVDSAFNDFKLRLIEAAKSILMAAADDPSCGLGPVVDEEAFKRLKELIEDPGDDIFLLYKGESTLKNGYYIAPSIFQVEDASHRFMQEEFFGPILTLMRVNSYEDALQIAVNTEFALTGAVYSRNPSHLEQARQKFRVGNLYLNRGSTGALVHRQPFGGFAMSGFGTKSGGPGYLLNFVDPRCMTENTMRRGFTPDIDN